MILAIDIGNSNIVIGGFENDSIEFTARVATDVRRTEEQYGGGNHQILHSVWIQCKGDGRFDYLLGSFAADQCDEDGTRQPLRQKRWLLVQGLKTGLNIKLDNPDIFGCRPRPQIL